MDDLQVAAIRVLDRGTKVLATVTPNSPDSPPSKSFKRHSPVLLRWLLGLPWALLLFYLGTSSVEPQFQVGHDLVTKKR